MKILLSLLALVGIALAVSLNEGLVQIPDRWNPLAPLVIADEPNLLTGFKLKRLGADAAQCRAVLAESAFHFKLLPDRDTGSGCGFTNAVSVSQSSVRLSSPLPLSCRAAVSLAMWERHVLQPAAMIHFGQPLARIDHVGSYACRNVYGRADGRRSQHATADAIDVTGFVLANGKRITVLADWTKPNPAGAFVHDAHDGGCRFFDGALGPDYNAAHRDHLHLDRGRFSVCR